MFVKRRAGNGVQMRIISHTASTAHTVGIFDKHFFNNIDRENTVRCLSDERLKHDPTRSSSASVDQVDCLGAFGQTRIFIATSEIEAQTGKRLIPRLQFRAFYMRVEVQVD